MTRPYKIRWRQGRGGGGLRLLVPAGWVSPLKERLFCDRLGYWAPCSEKLPVLGLVTTEPLLVR